ERHRVLRWASERFGAPPPPSLNGGRHEIGKIRAPEGDEMQKNLEELYSRAAPKTEPERALLVAYWMQEVCGDNGFEAQTVNSQLKHMGEKVSNITRALDELKKRKPQLVIQIQKSGKAK